VHGWHRQTSLLAVSFSAVIDSISSSRKPINVIKRGVNLLIERLPFPRTTLVQERQLSKRHTNSEGPVLHSAPRVRADVVPDFHPKGHAPLEPVIDAAGNVPSVE